MDMVEGADPRAPRISEMDIREVVRRLNGALGPTLVASLAGSRDPEMSHKWARADCAEPEEACARRLRFAYRQFRSISEVEGEQVARLWFIRANPALGDEPPVDAIRDDHLKATAAAAALIIHDGFYG